MMARGDVCHQGNPLSWCQHHKALAIVEMVGSQDWKPGPADDASVQVAGTRPLLLSVL